MYWPVTSWRRRCSSVLRSRTTSCACCPGSGRREDMVEPGGVRAVLCRYCPQNHRPAHRRRSGQHHVDLGGVRQEPQIRSAVGKLLDGRAVPQGKEISREDVGEIRLDFELHRSLTQFPRSRNIFGRINGHPRTIRAKRSIRAVIGLFAEARWDPFDS
jgi:hypothetical protein